MGVLIQYVVVQAVLIANILLTANAYAASHSAVSLALINLIEVGTIVSVYTATTKNSDLLVFVKKVGLVGAISALVSTFVILMLMGYVRLAESTINSISQSLLVGVFMVLLWLPLPALVGFYLRKIVEKCITIRSTQTRKKPRAG